MIEGVIVTPLKQILDDRGKVMHMLRSDSDVFIEFGEIYFSCIYPGAIKAWHIHRKMFLNYAVPHGNIKLVLYDDRESSSTRKKFAEIFLGPDNYCLVMIPPMIWNGFKCVGPETAIVANCSTIPHDPAEIDRIPPSHPSISYDWRTQNR